MSIALAATTWLRSGFKVSPLLSPRFGTLSAELVSGIKTADTQFNFEDYHLKIEITDIKDTVKQLTPVFTEERVEAFIVERHYGHPIMKDYRYSMWRFQFSIEPIIKIMITGMDDTYHHKTSVTVEQLEEAYSSNHVIMVPLKDVKAEYTDKGLTEEQVIRKLGADGPLQLHNIHVLTCGNAEIVFLSETRPVTHEEVNAFKDMPYIVAPSAGDTLAVDLMTRNSQKLISKHEGKLIQEDLEGFAKDYGLGYTVVTQVISELGQTVWTQETTIALEKKQIRKDLLKNWLTTATALLKEEPHNYANLRQDISINAEYGHIKDIMRALSKVHNEELKTYLMESLKLVEKYKRNTTNVNHVIKELID